MMIWRRLWMVTLLLFLGQTGLAADDMDGWVVVVGDLVKPDAVAPTIKVGNTSNTPAAAPLNLSGVALPEAAADAAITVPADSGQLPSAEHTPGSTPPMPSLTPSAAVLQASPTLPPPTSTLLVPACTGIFCVAAVITLIFAYRRAPGGSV